MGNDIVQVKLQLQGGELYKYQEIMELKKAVKCLITWYWDGKDGPAVTERFKKWNPVGNVKIYFPIHTLIGQNSAFAVTEVEDIKTLVMNIEPWTDLCTFEISPCIDSRELVAMGQ